MTLEEAYTKGMKDCLQNTIYAIKLYNTQTVKEVLTALEVSLANITKPNTLQ